MNTLESLLFMCFLILAIIIYFFYISLERVEDFNVQFNTNPESACMQFYGDRLLNSIPVKCLKYFKEEK